MAIKQKKKAKHKRSTKKGLPPGSLVFVGEQKSDQVKSCLFHYNENEFEERTQISNKEIIAELRDYSTVCWLNIDGLHDINVLEEIGQSFDINKLALEDILNTDQRPKLDAHDTFVLAIVKMFQYNPETYEFTSEQVSIIFTSNFVITFQEKEGDVFDSLRDRIRNKKGSIRTKSADYLFYALLDTLIDNYFHILEQVGERLEELEDIVLENPSQASLNQLHMLKKDIIGIRRAIYPLREVISKIERDDSEMINDTNKWYYRDLYDHTIQIIETIETYRDSASSLVDLYMSSVSNRMNSVMKVLTIISTIFIPLTFIAGIYGMNFENMPELKWQYGYHMMWGLMIVITIGQIFFFRNKKWL